jgi:soluble lytic murein transglycosylase-like protein
MNIWIATLPLNLIYALSTEHKIEVELIAAMVATESAGNTNAIRYEPHYKWTLDTEKYAKMNGVTNDTEVIAQKTSWGLLQVMGGVARELGFSSPLVKLTDPWLGLDIGIKKLKQLKAKYPKLEDVISSYNQGSPRVDVMGVYNNQDYVNKVLTKYHFLRSI